MSDPLPFDDEDDEASAFVKRALAEIEQARREMEAEAEFGEPPPPPPPASELLSVSEILAGLMEAAPEEPDRATIEARALRRVDECSYLNRSQLLEVATALRDAGLSATWIKEWRAAIAEQVKARQERQKVAIRQNQKPEGAADTWPYEIEGGRIMFLSQRALPDGGMTIQRTPVCDFTATITHEVTTEEGGKSFIVAGKGLRGGAFTVEIRAEAFADDRALKSALQVAVGALDPVRAGMVKHLAPAIQLFTEEEKRQRVARYERTGWQGARFIIPGREGDGIDIRLPRKLPYYLDREADFGQGLEALDALIQSVQPERATIALATMLQAPMAHLADWRGERYCLFVKGRTGSFKTAFAVVLMCLYGPDHRDEGRLIKWGEGATRNAVMGYATHAHDLPLLIDNYKPSTGGGSRDFINLIHNILEGSEKDRLNRSAELRDSRPIYCWPICTGEDVPDSDPASLARALVISFDWQRGESNPHLTEAQSQAHNLCAIGNEWIAWLESEVGQEVARLAGERFAERRDRWATWLRYQRSDMVNIMRVASSLAGNSLAWWAACQHPRIGPLLTQYNEAYRRGLEEVAGGMAEATAEALEASRFIEALHSLLSTGRCIFKTLGVKPADHEADRVVGWKDEEDDTVFLDFNQAKHEVLRLLGREALGGVSDVTIRSQIEALGYLASKDSGRTDKLKRVYAGGRGRYLHLKADVLPYRSVEQEVAERVAASGKPPASGSW